MSISRIDGRRRAAPVHESKSFLKRKLKAYSGGQDLILRGTIFVVEKRAIAAEIDGSTSVDWFQLVFVEEQLQSLGADLET